MAQQRNILTVSQLNRAANQLLGEHFFNVLVEGEISNLTCPSSGHLYFSLKDSNAQVRCALFKGQQRRLNFKPENGKQVIVKAEVSLYEPRGDYQLIVESMEEAGEGGLRRAFEQLKQKLLSQGLFDTTHKKPLPVLPFAIGVITSPTGAAIRDILSVLKRRFAAIPVIIFPVAVQGDSAKYEIVKAIQLANELCTCEVLIIGRGGGSLEDLWAFNEEMVARAIFASHIPIISAVGHETDVTIADFVADVRAPTPSVAAEIAVPEAQQWLARFNFLENRLQTLLQTKLQQRVQSLGFLNKRLEQQSPKQKLIRNSQRVDELELRLRQIMNSRFRYYESVLATKTAVIWQHHPGLLIQKHLQQQEYLQKRLSLSMHYLLNQLKQRLANSSETLQAVSPLATLNRGYAFAIQASTGQIIRSSEQLKVGELMETRFAHGQVLSEIKSI